MSFIDLNKVVKIGDQLQKKFNKDELLELVDFLFFKLTDRQVESWLNRECVDKRINYCTDHFGIGR